MPGDHKEGGMAHSMPDARRADSRFALGRLL